MKIRAFEPAGPLVRAPGGRSWEDFMRIALAEAKAGMEAGETPIGAAVIDPRGVVLAKHSNRVERDVDPTAHAEILCLREACRKIGSQRLEGCALVCSLEPCPMCAAACVHARLAGVVFGAANPREGAITSNIDYFDLPCVSRTVWHLGGVLSAACAQLLNDFFAARR